VDGFAAREGPVEAGFCGDAAGASAGEVFGEEFGPLVAGYGLERVGGVGGAGSRAGVSEADERAGEVAGRAGVERGACGWRDAADVLGERGGVVEGGDGGAVHRGCGVGWRGGRAADRYDRHFDQLHRYQLHRYQLHRYQHRSHHSHHSHRPQRRLHR